MRIEDSECWTGEKAPSDLGLDACFRRALRFSPTLTTGYTQRNLYMERHVTIIENPGLPLMGVILNTLEILLFL